MSRLISLDVRETLMKAFSRIAVLLVVIMGLVACGDAATPLPTNAPIVIVVTATSEPPTNTPIRAQETIPPTQTPVVIIVTATSEPPTNTPVPIQETVPPTIAPTATTKPLGQFSDDTHGIVNDDNVNIRYGPSLEYEVLTKRNRGDRVHVTGKNREGDWLELMDVSNHARGWIMAKYITLDIYIASIPIAQAPLIQPAEPPGEGSINEGSGVSASGSVLRVRVLYPRVMQEIGYSSAGNGRKFLVYGVIVSNDSPSTIRVSPFDLTLFGTNGIGESFDSATYNLGFPFEGVQVESGASTSGDVAFRVSADFVPAKMVYESLYDRVSVPLNR